MWCYTWDDGTNSEWEDAWIRPSNFRLWKGISINVADFMNHKIKKQLYNVVMLLISNDCLCHKFVF